MSSESAPASGRTLLLSGPARYSPNTAWGALSASLMTVVICGVSFVGMFLAIVFAVASGATETDVEQATEAMSTLASPIGLAAAAASQVLSLMVCWIAAARGGIRRETLQLANPVPGWGTFALAGLAVVLVTSAAELLMYASSDFNIFQDTKWLVEGLRSPLWWGTVIVGVVLAPLWEELTFRGFLLSALAKSPLGIVGGGLASNVAWTLLHWGYSWQGLASVFVAGILMTWLVWRTGSIWVPVVAHAIVNLAALVFTYVFSPY